MIKTLPEWMNAVKKSSFRLSQFLNNLATSGKTCWAIPPLVKNDLHIIGFHKKAKFFDLYFAKQSTPSENDSSTPIETKHLCDD